MRLAFLLFLITLSFHQNSFACSCGSYPSFEYSITNMDRESNILILGELFEFQDYDTNFPYSITSNEQYKYATITIVKNYIGNEINEKIYLLNGPSIACIRSLEYPIGSQLIILASKTNKSREDKQVYIASLCLESVLYYNKDKNMITGNITPYNSFLGWLYNFLGINRFPQDKMTLKRVEEVIERSL